MVCCLGLLALVQALGRTATASDASPVDSENLLVVLAPLVFIYGVSLFFTLFEQLIGQFPAFRFLDLPAFYLVVCAPLLLTFFPPYPMSVVYPPYYPPWIQQKARTIGENRVIMSDIPWAVAWYGRRESIWLSHKYIDRKSEAFRDDFYSGSQLRSVSALYLTAKSLKTMDIKALADWARQEGYDKDLEVVRKMVTDLGQSLIQENVKQADIDKLRSIYGVVEKNWVRGGGDDWDSFVLGIFVKKEVPSGFPLNRAVGGLVPEVFLMESER